MQVIGASMIEVYEEFQQEVGVASQPSVIPVPDSEGIGEGEHTSHTSHNSHTSHGSHSDQAAIVRSLTPVTPVTLSTPVTPVTAGDHCFQLVWNEYLHAQTLHTACLTAHVADTDVLCCQTS